MAEKRKIGNNKKLTVTYADYLFLIRLENELGSSESWSDRVQTLWQINEKLKKQLDANQEEPQFHEENTKEV